jgi:hypothetical protein
MNTGIVGSVATVIRNMVGIHKLAMEDITTVSKVANKLLVR